MTAGPRDENFGPPGRTADAPGAARAALGSVAVTTGRGPWHGGEWPSGRHRATLCAMFGRRIRCEPNGVHRVTTERLEIVSGRVSDLRRYYAMCAEPEIQRWMGWVGVPADAELYGAQAVPLWRPVPTVPANLEHMEFIGIHRRTNLVVGGLGLFREPGGHSVGGAVRTGFRGQRLGHELMAAVCDLLHRHFGLTELRAGCDASNEASRGWLAGAGFTRVDGPPTHTLPDGRVIDSLSWVRRDAAAKRRCTRLYETFEHAMAAARAAGTLAPEAPAPTAAGPLR